jgi:FtsP/CotA-like multicopper oxidase with cupredoxin domain
VVTKWIERHDGREGSTLLINGRENPTINVNGGQSERWRFINSSSARYFQLYLGGRKFTVIGSDGGLIERPYQVDKVLLVPGERVDIIGGPFEQDETVELESLPYNRVTFVKSKRQKFATIRVGERRLSSVTIPEILRAIEPLASPEAEVNRKVKFSVAPSLKHIIDFKVNNEVHANDAPVEVGKLQVWEVENTSLMDHPFHLHGFFFQVLAINGRPVQNIMWKDTVNLPPKSKIKIAWMPDNRPGKWMYHCHILEHHEAGMMAHFDVINPEEGGSTNHHHSCALK